MGDYEPTPLGVPILRELPCPHCGRVMRLALPVADATAQSPLEPLTEPIHLTPLQRVALTRRMPKG